MVVHRTHTDFAKLTGPQHCRDYDPSWCLSSLQVGGACASLVYRWIGSHFCMHIGMFIVRQKVSDIAFTAVVGTLVIDLSVQLTEKMHYIAFLPCSIRNSQSVNIIETALITFYLLW